MSDDDEIRERFVKRESRRVGLEALAEQLCARLDAVASEDAKKLAEQGRETAQRFAGWTDRPPPPDERTEALADVMGFNARALEFLRETETGDDPELDRRKSDDDI